MDLKEFDYELPESLIAAYPSREREASRLLVICHRQTGEIVHSVFAEIGEFLDPGDLLVLNDTKVFPARLARHEGERRARSKCCCSSAFQKPGEVCGSP